MIRSYRAALAGLALTLALPACAAPAPKATNDADPALWVVKDKDTTIYLFGTIHVLKPGLTWFDEAVKKAFDRSDELVLEIVQPDPAQMQGLVMANGLATGGPPLSEQLTPEKRAAYTKALAEAGLPGAAFDKMKPWLAAVSLSLLPLQKAGYDSGNGPETVLASAAQAAKKPVSGLETAEEQLKIFGSLSQPAQISFLNSTVEELPKAQETMATMVRDWAEGKPEALADQMNESLKDSPEVAKKLLVDRNARWADWVAQRMARPGTVFVAVGAGHLAGPESVQAQLARKQVTATRIRY